MGMFILTCFYGSCFFLFSKQRDIQQTSSSSPVNTTLRLFGGDLGCDWEELCYPEKTMTSISSNSKTKMIGLQPVIARQIQTLASLESNYETSEDEEHIEKELGEMDQVGEEFADEEEMEDDFDEEDVNDDDEDYVDFCNFLTKSPACDAAASRFIHTSFVTSSFSFSMTNDDDSSEEEDETGDIREEDASENDSADEDEFDWSTPQTSYIGGFDPFAVSGLFMPSLLSTLAYGSPSVTDEKPCNSDNDSDLNEGEVKELAQKLKDVNRRWLEMYSNSKDCGDSTKVDAENCITSKAIEVSCKKNVSCIMVFVVCLSSSVFSS